jgi:hypothetical protein
LWFAFTNPVSRYSYPEKLISSDLNQSPFEWEKDAVDQLSKQADKRKRNRINRQPLERDSLRSRYRFGKPGSRRNRRYRNSVLADNEIAQYVIDAAQLSGSDSDEPIFEFSNHFQQVGFQFFEDADGDDKIEESYTSKNRRSDSKRVETFESLNDLDLGVFSELDSLCSDVDGSDGALSDSASNDQADLDWDSVDGIVRRLVQLAEFDWTAPDMYRRISRQARGSLRKQLESRFLKELEFALVAYRYGRLTPMNLDRYKDSPRIKLVYRSIVEHMQHVRVINPTDEQILQGFMDRYPNSLLLEVESSYHRLVVHGVSEYYGLCSHSEIHPNSTQKKIMIIRIPTRSNLKSSRRRRSTRRRKQNERNTSFEVNVANSLSGHMNHIFSKSKN